MYIPMYLDLVLNMRDPLLSTPGPRTVLEHHKLG
jgi:hypothetical protein